MATFSINACATAPPRRRMETLSATEGLNLLTQLALGNCSLILRCSITDFDHASDSRAPAITGDSSIQNPRAVSDVRYLATKVATCSTESMMATLNTKLRTLGSRALHTTYQTQRSEIRFITSLTYRRLVQQLALLMDAPNEQPSRLGDS